jgi:hypothetical protein
MFRHENPPPLAPRRYAGPRRILNLHSLRDWNWVKIMAALVDFAGSDDGLPRERLHRSSNNRKQPPQALSDDWFGSVACES